MKSDFAGMLSSLRKEKGLSQRCAATDLGVSQALLSHYENGAREPRLEFVAKVCDYYGVTADYILGRNAARETRTLPLPHGCDSAGRYVSAVFSIFETLDETADPKLYAAAVDYLALPAENISALLSDPFMEYNPMRDAEQKISEAAFVAQARQGKSTKP